MHACPIQCQCRRIQGGERGALSWRGHQLQPQPAPALRLPPEAASLLPCT
jgi:hypothetical protein